MAHDCTITDAVKMRQKLMFRLAATEKYGSITHKMVHYETGLSTSIIGQYARGETAMGLPAALKIRKVVGAELFSLLFEDGDHLIEVSDDIDHDTLSTGCIDYAHAWMRARQPDSPAGVEIAPCEDKELKAHAAKLQAVGG